MISDPKLERRRKQNYVAIRMAVPIPFGKYLQPAWDEVQEWLTVKGITTSGPAMIRYLTTDMSKALDIDVGFTVDRAVKGDDRITANFLPAGRYAKLFYTGPYRGKGTSKPPLPCSSGQRRTRSNGILRRKKASNGGTAAPSSTSPTRLWTRIPPNT